MMTKKKSHRSGATTAGKVLAFGIGENKERHIGGRGLSSIFNDILWKDDFIWFEQTEPEAAYGQNKKKKKTSLDSIFIWIED